MLSRVKSRLCRRLDNIRRHLERSEASFRTFPEERDSIIVHPVPLPVPCGSPRGAEFHTDARIRKSALPDEVLCYRADIHRFFLGPRHHEDTRLIGCWDIIRDPNKMGVYLVFLGSLPTSCRYDTYYIIHIYIYIYL